MPKYDYVNVDPKVIQMLGGDETSLLTEDFGGADLSDNDVDEYSLNMRNDSKVFDTPTFSTNKNNVVDQGNNRDYLLNQILNELREIKIILAGR